MNGGDAVFVDRLCLSVCGLYGSCSPDENEKKCFLDCLLSFSTCLVEYDHLLACSLWACLRKSYKYRVLGVAQTVRHTPSFRYGETIS